MGDTISQAKEALNLGLMVVGAGSIAFVAASWKLSSEEEILDRGRASLAVLLASVSVVLALVAVILMAPIAWETIGKNRGQISGFLVGYDLIFVLVSALLLTTLAAFVRAAHYALQAVRAYRD